MGEQIKELKKHVATIQCANTFSLLQRKLSNALLHHAYPKLMEQEEHEITVKQLCNAIAYSGNNHSVIKDALRGLLSIVIEWNLIDKNNTEDWSASSMLASVNIKGSICRYAYSPRLRKLLYSPEQYAKINLITQAKFKSSYGLALYENCIRYRGLPCTRWLELAQFRKIMGVSDGTYSVYKYFKKRVLDKAIDEVNTNSDLFVVSEVRKNERGSKEIRFMLREREKKPWLGVVLTKEQNGGEEITHSTDLIERLRKQFGFAKARAQKLCKDFPEEIIGEKIKIIEASSSYLNGKVKNLAAYLLSALKEDYQLPKVSLNNAEIINREKQEEECRANQKKEQEDALERQYNNYFITAVDTMLDKLDPQSLENLENQFITIFSRTYPHDTVTIQKYKKDGLNNPTVKKWLRIFIKEHHPELIQHILSSEEYRQSLEIK